MKPLRMRYFMILILFTLLIQPSCRILSLKTIIAAAATSHLMLPA